MVKCNIFIEVNINVHGSTREEKKNGKIVETKRKIRLTGGESSSLVTTSELDVEVGDQSMDVVIPLHLQAEW